MWWYLFCAPVIWSRDCKFTDWIIYLTSEDNVGLVSKRKHMQAVVLSHTVGLFFLFPFSNRSLKCQSRFPTHCFYKLNRSVCLQCCIFNYKWETSDLHKTVFFIYFSNEIIFPGSLSYLEALVSIYISAEGLAEEYKFIFRFLAQTSKCGLRCVLKDVRLLWTVQC